MMTNKTYAVGTRVGRNPDTSAQFMDIEQGNWGMITQVLADGYAVRWDNDPRQDELEYDHAELIAKED